VTQRFLNLWPTRLGEIEDLEVRTNVEANFTELYDRTNPPAFADETAAAKGGVPFGGFYHTDGALKVRYTHKMYPAAASISLVGRQPIVRHLMTRRPAAGSVTLAGAAPIIRHLVYRTPAAANLALTGYAPSVVVG
jgi:hypothetical protein